MTDLHDILWRGALDAFAAGDPRELARLIRSRTPAPADAALADAVSALVADVLEGRRSPRSKRGPVARLTTPQAFALRVAADDMKRAGVPESVRVDRLASRFGVSAGAVRDALATRRRASKVSR